MKPKTGLVRAGDTDLVQDLAESLILTPAQERLLNAAVDIRQEPATAEDACYLHTVLCQVGMPRKRTDGLEFIRTNGGASLRLTAGKLFNGREWIQQQLPYGAKPRLILINLTSAAVKTRSRVIDVGRSMREFMERMGLDSQGSEYRSLRRQIAALAACRMQLGVRTGNQVINVDTQPVHRFDVWLTPNAEQQTLWPGTVELSADYFDSALRVAVPLDERVVVTLRGSALELDIYSCFAQRLCRIRDRNGVHLPWKVLQAQFGQEYNSLKNFRKKFLIALHHVVKAYPDARVVERADGLRLYESRPPIPRMRLP